MELIIKADYLSVIGKFTIIIFIYFFRATLVSNIHREADKVAE